MQASRRTQAIKKTNQCLFLDYEHTTDVVLPSEGVQRDRVHILVKNERDRHHKGKDVEPLGAEAERQNLDRVRHDERRKRDIVRGVKQKYERDHRMSGCSGPVLGVLGKAHRLGRVKE